MKSTLMSMFRTITTSLETSLKDSYLFMPIVTSFIEFKHNLYQHKRRHCYQIFTDKHESTVLA